jgi:hypothetical protein
MLAATTPPRTGPFSRLTSALLTLLLLLSQLPPAQAATPPAPGVAARSLAEALNPDGTFKADMAGSFDPKGFRMSTAPDGRPVFRPTRSSGAGDENWQDGFALPGADWPVYAVASSGTDVYIGGLFKVVGTTAANYVAKWNGSTWSALGTGLGGTVRALAVSGTDVYAGGEFTTAGGAPANRIARWNGSAWSTLGSGMNSEVHALAVSGSDVYAGGYFTTAGGVAATRIARWNGSAWSALGTGVNDGVRALAVSGTDVYAAGSFTTAGGAAANYVARWNGSSWSALGTGLNSVVMALAVSGANVYVAGYFTTAGGGAANRVARWNGSSWSALGGGVGTGPDEAPRCITVSGSTVYVGGDFTTAGGGAAANIARWNGSSWSALGTGASYIVFGLALVGTDVYAGGSFLTAGPVTANFVAKYSGSTWSTLTTGLDAAVLAVVVSGPDIYLAGNFTVAAGVPASRIVKYNNGTWTPLGTGLSDAVYTMTMSGTDLYVGGNFLTAGGVTVNRVAKWDGSAWSALGTGANVGIGGGSNLAVRALAVIGADVYVGGNFNAAGGVPANYLARYNSGTWSALGTGVNGGVSALAVSGTDLYVGGGFITAGGLTVNRVAKWSGGSWSALGTGTNGGVGSLAVSGTNLYASGSFGTAGGVAAFRVAKWDGTAWSALGAGVLGSPQVIVARGPELYVSGDFTTASGVTVNRIARWNGSAWSSLGTGLNGIAYALAIGPDGKLNAGGAFTTVGDASKVTAYFGRYTLAAVNELPIIAAQAFSVAENSAAGTAVGTVTASDPEGATLVYSITGGNTGGTFAINSSTGAITVASPAVLDFETMPVFALTVQASDGGTSSTAAVTVTLTDVVENGPLTFIATTASNPTSTIPIPVTVTFTEGVTGFVAADVVVGNGTISNFVVVSSTDYSFDVTPTAAGTVTVNIASSVAQNGSGDGNQTAQQLSLQYVLPPSAVVAIVRNMSSPNKAAAVTYQATFTRVMTGLTPARFTLTTSGLSGASVSSVTGSGMSFLVTVNTGTGNGTLQLRLTNSTGLTPLPNNMPFAGEVYVIDKTRPATTISSLASPATSVTPIPVTVTFSEAVLGFADTNVMVGNGTLSNFAGSGTTYTFDVTPTASGAVTVNVPAGATADAASNLNTAAPQLSIVYTATVTAAPVLTSPAGSSLLNANTPTYAGTAPASSTVTVYVDNTAIGTTAAAGDGSFSLAQPTALSEGSHTVWATAQLSGLAVSADSNANPFTVDTVPPAVSISSSAGAGGSTTSTSPIPFTVTFSESVTGFSASTVSVSNGTLNGFSGSGTTYTFDVTPAASGTVTVSVPAGAAVDAAGNGNTAAPPLSLVYAAPLAAVVWNGSVSTSWFEAANWTPAQVPTTTIDATIPAGAPRYPVLATGTAFAQVLTLAPGGSLGQSGGVLDLSQGWTNNGTFTATGGTVSLSSPLFAATISGSSRSTFWNLTVALVAFQNPNPGGVAIRRVLQLNGSLITFGSPLTLLSDATGTAMVVNAGGSIFGRLTVQRYIAPDRNPGLGYRHLSSPVGGSTVGELAFPGFAPVVNPAYNSSATPGSVTPFPTVYGYDQARLAGTANNLSPFDKGWVSPAALTEALSPGRGYTVNLPAATVSFAGSAGNNDLTLSLARNAGPSAAEAGWSLVGNPYPAPLDYALVDPADRPGLDAAMYVYESTSRYGGQYRSYLPPVGGNPGIGNPLLPLGQGFFVRVSAGQPSGSLTFRNSQRLTTYQNPGYQRATADVRPTVQLTLAGAGLHDDYHLYAEASATAGLDAQLDAVKLPNPNGLNLAALTPAGEMLAIDGRPAFAPALSIPLSVGVPAAGAYTLTAATVANLGSTRAELVDNLTFTRTLLTPGASYRFTLAGTTAPGRFWLHLAPAAPLATAGAAPAAPVLVYPNPAHGRLTVLRPPGAAPTATLLNSLGQSVRTIPLPSAETMVNLSGLAAGVYALRLMLDGGQVLTQRVVVE